MSLQAGEIELDSFATISVPAIKASATRAGRPDSSSNESAKEEVEKCKRCESC